MENEEKDYSAFMPNDENKTENEQQTENNSETPIVNQTQSSVFEQRNQSELIWLAQKVGEVQTELQKYLIGQTEMTTLLLVGMFSNGHVLLEGVPGVAKTLASKSLSQVLDVQFSRIQFTPDLMPSDVLGTSVFNMKDSSFNFKKGPIFSNIVLIDEINRAPAKTQAALFEVMEERQITFDGERYEMSFPFLVLATQNPVEQEGTYNLPEAQLDRFLFKVKLDYPSLEEEAAILTRYRDQITAPDLSQIKAIFNATELKKVQGIVANVVIEQRLIEYIAQVIHKTRNHGKLYLGASPRASLSILKSAKALAAIQGRDFVTPDDIQFVAVHVLNHRLILTPEADMEGLQTEDVIQEILKSIEVPR